MYRLNIVKLFWSIVLLLFTISCREKTVINPDDEAPGFTNERMVTIVGYGNDAMEPFISKDDRYLFFNNLRGPNNKDIFYAEKINDTTFEFKGEVQGVNTPYVDGNPTMDAQNIFYFISTRDLDIGNKTIFSGSFSDGKVTGLHPIEGSINIPEPYRINMGVEISKDGNTLYTSNAKFNIGENFPHKGNIRFALKNENAFNIPGNEADIMVNINNDNAIQYAGEISSDGLELFYSQVTLSDPPVFELLYAKRELPGGIFNKPVAIAKPFESNSHAIVEAPSLSDDGRRLYYHKMDKERGIYSIFMLSRE